MIQARFKTYSRIFDMINVIIVVVLWIGLLFVLYSIRNLPSLLFVLAVLPFMPFITAWEIRQSKPATAKIITGLWGLLYFILIVYGLISYN